MYPDMTDKQLSMFQWVEDYFLEKDRLPSAGDMMNAFNFKSPNTFTTYMVTFANKGLIEKVGCYYRFSRNWPGRNSMEARRMVERMKNG